MKIARRWRLRGRVQGVGFRHHVRTNAVALGVTGWVQMLPEGECVVHGEGDTDQLVALEQRLVAASTYSAAVASERADVPLEGCTSFEILH